jgi:hypothetical protein
LVLLPKNCMDRGPGIGTHEFIPMESRNVLIFDLWTICQGPSKVMIFILDMYLCKYSDYKANFFLVYDCYNICKEICAQDLTLTFIFTSNIDWNLRIIALLLVSEVQIELTLYRKSNPRNLTMYLYLTYILRSNQGHDVYFRIKMSLS